LLVQSISKLNIIFASVKQRGIGAACMANWLTFRTSAPFYKQLDKICTASLTYVHVLSLCPLYPLPCTWKNYKWELSKDTFSHTILHTTVQLRYMK
jgi:hypothetical protein